MYFHSYIVCSTVFILKGFPGGSDSKESACNAGDLGSIPWVGKIKFNIFYELRTEKKGLFH